MEQLAELFNSLTAFIDSLTNLVTDSPATYLVIFAFAALDVVFPLLPAEASVTAAAVLAGQGKLNIAAIMVAAALGAFVGDNMAYWIGRFAGRPLVVRLMRGNMSQLDRVQEQFHERGGLFVIIGRFIPGGRTATAIGAGVLHFSWPKFVLYDALAAIVWAFQAALPGFIGGRLISDKPWLAILFGFLLSATLAATIYLIQRWWSRTHPTAVRVRPAVVGIERIHPDHDSHDETPLSNGGPG
jgi:membrane protein DedA with SNARE-associated domain